MKLNIFTKHSIFSLPLIFKELNKKILLSNRFINMYLADINQPLLSNSIFLMFHYPSIELIETLKSYKEYITTYTLVIEEIRYCVFVFKRTDLMNFIINNTNKGLYYENSYNDKIQILNFWEVKPSSKIHSYLFNPDCVKEKPINENITIRNKKAVTDKATAFIFY